jgi:VanZ family protein
MLARLGSWLCFTVLAVLTLLPGKEMEPMRQSYYALGLSVEHLVAYAGTAVVTLWAYGARFGALRIGVFLAGYGALLELGQLFSPGRTAQLVDALENVVGILVGMLVFLFVRAVSSRNGPSALTWSWGKVGCRG